ncbi:MAG: response regulator transcription factor [Oscillospiraceae bacterium]
MGKKILVVEDERNIVDILTFNLGREGYDTLEALDGAEGLRLALAEDPDLILLDLMLPKMDGFEVCRRLREQGRATPVIMLTAREEETDKVLGLELGADDYITKPFSMRELLARVKSNIRRTDMLTRPASAGGSRMELGRVQVDLDAMVVYKDGEPLELTQREYELVKALASARGQAVSRESLMKQVWNFDGYVGDVRAVDVAIRRLREKLEDDPADPRFIITRRGLGYAFGKNAEPS